MLVECGIYRLVERCETGTVKHAGTVVVIEVRETGVQLGRRRVEHHGEWRVTRTWVKILSRSIRVRVRERHLPCVPTGMVPVCVSVLFELTMLLLSSREIGNTPSHPGGSLAS